MAKTETPSPVPVTIAGRDIKIHPIAESKLALLMHQSRILQLEDVTKERVERALSLVYRTIMSAIIDSGDREFVEDLIADDKMELTDLVGPFVKAGQEEDEEPVKPVVRRGRPRKQV